MKVSGIVVFFLFSFFRFIAMCTQHIDIDDWNKDYDLLIQWVLKVICTI